MSSVMDETAYKAKLQQDWDGAAPAWRAAIELIEAGGAATSNRLLGLADVSAGDRVLDVASGYGEPALSAARITGASGRVVSLDLSAEMQSTAVARAAAAGLDNVEFVHGDVEALDWTGGEFDAVVCRWGAMFFARPVETLARVRGWLRPGGRVALATWSVPERVPFASLPARAISETLELPPPPPGRPGMFALADPERVAAILRDAGLVDVEVGTDAYVIETASAEELIDIIKQTAPPLRDAMAGHTPQDQARAWQAAIDVMRTHESADGRLRLTNEYVWAVGTRPSTDGTEGS